MQHEQSLIIMKPDAIQRNLVGEIIKRFEQKGLKIIGLKMIHFSDILLDEHYVHLTNKPFYPGLKKYLKSAPVIIIALAGYGIVDAIRTIVGPTNGLEASAGTIRGDFSMSKQSNVVHASDSVENSEQEIKRFFKQEELLDYEKLETQLVFSDLLE